MVYIHTAPSDTCLTGCSISVKAQPDSETPFSMAMAHRQYPARQRVIFAVPALCSLAAPQSNSLAILLQLGNQLIALTNNILVLLVLVVWSVGFNNTLARDAVDGAGNAAGSDESSKITRINPSVAGVLSRFLCTWDTYRSRKSTVTPKSLAMLSKPTTR